MIFCVSVVVVEDDPTPKSFSKYYLNSTIYPDPHQHFSDQTEYFMDAVRMKGRSTSYQPMYKMDLYFLNETSQEAYVVFTDSKGKIEGCQIDPGVEYSKFDVLKVIESEIESYLGTKECGGGDGECDTWKLKNYDVYWADEKTGEPVKIVDQFGDLVMSVNGFKDGEDAFDESVVFKLPVDPSTCKK